MTRHWLWLKIGLLGALLTMSILVSCRTIHSGYSSALMYHHALANMAFYQHNINQAMDELQQAIKVESTDPEAYRRLAYLYFYFQRSYDKAIKRSLKGIELAPDDPQSYVILGKIQAGQQDFSLAIDSFQTALSLNPPLPYECTYELARCYLALQDTSEAERVLRQGIEMEPNYNPANRLMHTLLVQRGHYREALDIWRVDNLVISQQETFGNFWKWYNEIQDALRAIEQNPDDTNAYLQLALAYFDAHLYEESRIVLERITRLNPTLRSIQRRLDITNSYLNFMKEVKMITDAHYMRVINNEGNDFLYRNELWDAFVKMARFYPELGQPPLRYEEVFFNKLRDKIGSTFQAVIVIGRTDGVLDCHFGHIIAQEERRITLWDEKANVRAVYLDYMVSNGYGSWAWQYQTQHGGFSSSRDIYTVYHIRPPYVKRVVQDWWLVTHHPSREWYKNEAQKGELSTQKKPLDVYYSPQLQHRLRLKEIDRIYDNLRDRGSQTNEQHSFFLQYVLHNITEASIFNHEGQHAVDQIHTNISNGPLLEYRSKLSELKYANFPFLTLSELMTPDLGSESYHGQANQRVFESIVSYIYLNPKQFPMFDFNKNIMNQIYKLDKDQLREIIEYNFRAIDSKV